LLDEELDEESLDFGFGGGAGFEESDVLPVEVALSELEPDFESVDFDSDFSDSDDLPSEGARDDAPP